MLSQQVLIRHARNVVADYPGERPAIRLFPIKVRHSIRMIQIKLKKLVERLDRLLAILINGRKRVKICEQKMLQLGVRLRDTF